jgi:serine/threonine protein phosphatase PrpC
MRLRVAAGTDVGRVRDRNEDAYMVRARDGLFVVCDGMGGAPAGDVASRLAIAAMLRQLGHASACGDRPADRAFLPHTKRLVEAVRRSNAFVYEEAQRAPERAGMGTTLVGAWIHQHVAGVAHVGDSRAYLWHRDRLEPLTRDHALTDGYANVLLRALGREAEVDVDVREVTVEQGDYVLLCSDGLTRLVPEPVVAEALVRMRHPRRICDYLIAAANENGGTDNITIIVVEVAGSRWTRLMNGWTGA